MSLTDAQDSVASEELLAGVGTYSVDPERCNAHADDTLGNYGFSRVGSELNRRFGLGWPS